MRGKYTKKRYNIEFELLANYYLGSGHVSKNKGSVLLEGVPMNQWHEKEQLQKCLKGLEQEKSGMNKDGLRMLIDGMDSFHWRMEALKNKRKVKGKRFTDKQLCRIVEIADSMRECQTEEIADAVRKEFPNAVLDSAFELCRETVRLLDVCEAPKGLPNQLQKEFIARQLKSSNADNYSYYAD